MIKTLFFFLAFLSIKTFAQPKFQPTEKYMYLVARGYNLYNEKNYKASALAFDSAFISTKGLGIRRDFYHAAGSWALANNPDKSFAYLNKATLVYKYSEVSDVESSTDFESIHQDKRWLRIIKQVIDNKVEKEAKWNKQLVAELNTILHDDQDGRSKLYDTRIKYGKESTELKDLWQTIEKKDSINLIKVKTIIKKYGWLSPKDVGDKGAGTIFLVIQHSDTTTLITYLPIMREAVKNGKARLNDFSLLEDRALVYQGKEQIYGTQVNIDSTKAKFFPIKDEQNVNKRRAAAGLEPLEDYAKNFGIVYVLPTHK